MNDKKVEQGFDGGRTFVFCQLYCREIELKNLVEIESPFRISLRKVRLVIERRQPYERIGVRCWREFRCCSSGAVKLV